MKVAILGAGFTGLSAAYHLAKKHQVTIFEKENIPGGLAISFQQPDWEWPLEKHYHHFFTSDREIINLASEIGREDLLLYPDSLTSLYRDGKIYPFNTVSQILNFSSLSLSNRIRLGLVSLFLKLLPKSFGQYWEKYSAVEFAKLFYGEEIYQTVWEPLLKGKFGKYFDQVNGAWLWARIKKRTLQLGYFKGGYQAFAQALEKKVKEKNITVEYNQEVQRVTQLKNGQWQIQTKDHSLVVDMVISTLPTPVFLKLFPDLPKDYQNNLTNIPHLHALNLLLESEEPFFKDTYWLNINDETFPFLCVVEQTNFIDKKHYGNHHLLYIGNYLPEGHPYFKKTPEELLQIYTPYLKKIINSKPACRQGRLLIINSYLFTGPFAQPVFLKNYSKIRPFGKTPLKNLYFANLDSVYPWDRGTNYALEIGKKVAEEINNSQ